MSNSENTTLEKLIQADPLGAELAHATGNVHRWLLDTDRRSKLSPQARQEEDQELLKSHHASLVEEQARTADSAKKTEESSFSLGTLVASVAYGNASWKERLHLKTVEVSQKVSSLFSRVTQFPNKLLHNGYAQATLAASLIATPLLAGGATAVDGDSYSALAQQTRQYLDKQPLGFLSSHCITLEEGKQQTGAIDRDTVIKRLEGKGLTLCDSLPLLPSSSDDEEEEVVVEFISVEIADDSAGLLRPLQTSAIEIPVSEGTPSALTLESRLEELGSDGYFPDTPFGARLHSPAIAEGYPVKATFSFGSTKPFRVGIGSSDSRRISLVSAVPEINLSGCTLTGAYGKNVEGSREIIDDEYDRHLDRHDEAATSTFTHDGETVWEGATGPLWGEDFEKHFNLNQDTNYGFLSTKTPPSDCADSNPSDSDHVQIYFHNYIATFSVVFVATSPDFALEALDFVVAEYDGDLITKEILPLHVVPTSKILQVEETVYGNARTLLSPLEKSTQAAFTIPQQPAATLTPPPPITSSPSTSATDTLPDTVYGSSDSQNSYGPPSSGIGSGAVVTVPTPTPVPTPVPTVPPTLVPTPVPVNPNTQLPGSANSEHTSLDTYVSSAVDVLRNNEAIYSARHFNGNTLSSAFIEGFFFGRANVLLRRGLLQRADIESFVDSSVEKYQSTQFSQD